MKLYSMIGKLLYCTLGSALPDSGKSDFARKTRRVFAQMMLGKLDKHVNINRNAHFSNKIKIGDYSGIGNNAFLQGTVNIGKYVMMGSNVKMYTINHANKDLTKPMCFQGNSKEKPIIIEDDVWIGDSVIILPGVKIGKGSILGAGAVIRENVPDYAIMIGNPAVVLRYRGDKNEKNFNCK